MEERVPRVSHALASNVERSGHNYHAACPAFCLIRSISSFNSDDGIVRMYGVTQLSGEPCLLLERCASDVLSYLPNANRSLGFKVHLLHIVASALKQIHACNMVHRDLKPENILLRRLPSTPLERPDVCIADFGTARHKETLSHKTVRLVLCAFMPTFFPNSLVLRCLLSRLARGCTWLQK